MPDVLGAQGRETLTASSPPSVGPSGTALFGTIESWLIWSEAAELSPSPLTAAVRRSPVCVGCPVRWGDCRNLSGGAAGGEKTKHITDVSNASAPPRALLNDLFTLQPISQLATHLTVAALQAGPC